MDGQYGSISFICTKTDDLQVTLSPSHLCVPALAHVAVFYDLARSFCWKVHIAVDCTSLMLHWKICRKTTFTVIVRMLCM